jgi:Protein of unknown function (DUF993)
LSGSIKLVRADGSLYRYTPPPPVLALPRSGSFNSRVAFAAAHVVADPLRTQDPIAGPAIDWQATLAYREYLWSLGFGVAEAMDTAQRGTGLHWPMALELIRRSSSAAAARKAMVFCGAGTDHLPPGPGAAPQDIIDAYLQQCEAIESAGGRIVVMASRALAAIARHAEDYALVYARVLESVHQPVIIHWLGPMFDPALTGYWGSSEIAAAAENCLSVVHAHKMKVDGIKISLLDADLELSMRRSLPPGVRMYTGDDFNYDRLILGDGEGHSDALLGIFDAIAPVASLALSALDRSDTEQFNRLLAPTIPLSRHIFSAPTQYYKTGIVFLAFLNGFQQHFRMVGGLESARSISHLCQLFVLAGQAGAIVDPDLAIHRMHRFLQFEGVE